MNDKELIEQVYSMVIADITYFKELANPSESQTPGNGMYSDHEHAVADLATAAYARKIKRFIEQHSKAD